MDTPAAGCPGSSLADDLVAPLVAPPAKRIKLVVSLADGLQKRFFEGIGFRRDSMYRCLGQFNSRTCAPPKKYDTKTAPLIVDLQEWFTTETKLLTCAEQAMPIVPSNGVIALKRMVGNGMEHVTLLKGALAAWSDGGPAMDHETAKEVLGGLISFSAAYIERYAMSEEFVEEHNDESCNYTYWMIDRKNGDAINDVYEAFGEES